jgi:hypothetical protein
LGMKRDTLRSLITMPCLSNSPRMTMWRTTGGSTVGGGGGYGGIYSFALTP